MLVSNASALIKALKSGDTHALGLVLSGEPDAVHTQDKWGYTPLHWAAIWGQDEAVRLLAEVGADLNAQAGNAQTPLHQAVLHERPSTVETLLQLGAHSDVQNYFEATPLHLAATKGRADIVALLLQAGASCFLVNAEGEIPVDKAADEVTRSALAHPEALQPWVAAELAAAAERGGWDIRDGVTLPSCMRPPDVTASGETWLQVEWKPPTDLHGHTVLCYQLQWKEAKHSDKGWMVQVGPEQLTMTLSDLTGRRIYLVRVRCLTVTGWSKWSPTCHKCTMAPPEITLQPAARTVVKQGGEIILQLKAAAMPPPTYQWVMMRTKETHVPDLSQITRLPTGEEVVALPEQTTSRLVIASAEGGHTGSYHCLVTNKMGVTVSGLATVFVRDKENRVDGFELMMAQLMSYRNEACALEGGEPTFVPDEATDPPPIIMLVCGDPLRLLFKFKAAPMPEIRWMKDGKNIPYWQEKNTKVPNEALLELETVGVDHTGIYTCELENGVATTISAPVRVHVFRNELAMKAELVKQQRVQQAEVRAKSMGATAPFHPTRPSASRPATSRPHAGPPVLPTPPPVAPARLRRPVALSMYDGTTHDLVPGPLSAWDQRPHTSEGGARPPPAEREAAIARRQARAQSASAQHANWRPGGYPRQPSPPGRTVRAARSVSAPRAASSRPVRDGGERASTSREAPAAGLRGRDEGGRPANWRRGLLADPPTRKAARQRIHGGVGGGGGSGASSAMVPAEFADLLSFPADENQWRRSGYGSTMDPRVSARIRRGVVQGVALGRGARSSLDGPLHLPPYCALQATEAGGAGSDAMEGLGARRPRQQEESALMVSGHFTKRYLAPRPPQSARTVLEAGQLSTRSARLVTRFSADEPAAARRSVSSRSVHRRDWKNDRVVHEVVLSGSQTAR